MNQKIINAIAAAILFLAVMACGTSTKPVETNTKVENKPSETNKITPLSSPSSSPTSTTTTSTDIAGNYSITGKSADGKAYEGSIAVTKRDEVYQISWKVGNDEYDGVAVQQGNAVAASYTTGKDGKGCGAVIYKINSDDSLDGKFGEWGINKSGTEKATPSEKTTNTGGNFDVTGTNADGKPYKGKLAIKRGSEDVYQFSWDLGSKDIGTGVKMGEYLAAGLGSKQCGFVIYEIKDGNLEGKWGIPGSIALGTEKAVKK